MILKLIKIEITNGRTCEASRIMGEKLAELSLRQNITKKLNRSMSSTKPMPLSSFLF